MRSLESTLRRWRGPPRTADAGKRVRASRVHRPSRGDRQESARCYAGTPPPRQLLEHVLRRLEPTPNSAEPASHAHVSRPGKQHSAWLHGRRLRPECARLADADAAPPRSAVTSHGQSSRRLRNRLALLDSRDAPSILRMAICPKKRTEAECRRKRDALVGCDVKGLAR